MPKDYDYDELFPGRFLKAAEFKDRDVTLVIARVEIEELPDKKGTIVKDGERFRVRGLISFTAPNGRPIEKQLVLNRTNGECIKAMFGRKTSAWVGKRVTFFPAMVEAFGEETPAIRVRGSPDIEKDITAELRLGQKTRKATLKKTGQAANGNGRAAAAPPPKPPEPPPPSDGLPGDGDAASSGDEEFDEFNRGFGAAIAS